MAGATTPLILFGAFDRHNLGDMLFAHLAATCVQGRAVVFAGLAERDLGAHGGHRVRAIARLAREWGCQPADCLHVGGELITCDLYEAAVMLLTPAAATQAIARYDRDPKARLSWARGQLGLAQGVAYMVPKALFARPGRFVYHAVGGVDFANRAPELRAEALARLREADAVSVRDRLTASQLTAAGLNVELAPDLAELVAECLAGPIQARAETGEVAAVRARFPQGYLAVQCAAAFGDDATLSALAAGLDAVAAESGLGLVCFRAGAAPWHDDLAVYRRLRGFLRTAKVWLFESLHLFDICALLARARAFCGSSLHGRIVAAAFGVPGVTLLPPGQDAGTAKVSAYWATWHEGELPALDWVPATLAALTADREALRAAARVRAQQARRAWQASLARLTP